MIDPLDLVSPQRYAAGDFPHDAWTELRATDPVHWTEPPGYRPFWAITKHADIKYISSHPDLFSSKPRLTLQTIQAEQEMLAMFPDAADQGGMPLRMLVTMDPPDHRDYRNLAGPYFRPSVLQEPGGPGRARSPRCCSTARPAPTWSSTSSPRSRRGTRCG